MVACTSSINIKSLSEFSPDPSFSYLVEMLKLKKKKKKKVGYKT